MLPLPMGTMAILEVIAWSGAFNVETSGRFTPFGQSERYANEVTGTTVAFTTTAEAFEGTLQEPATGIVIVPLKGCSVPEIRVSSTRQGATA